MSVATNEVVDSILTEYFGDISTRIVFSIRCRGYCSIKDMIQDSISIGKCRLRINEVKKALCALIRHNIVTVIKNERGLLVYQYDYKNALAMLRFPHFVLLIKNRYGNVAAAICEEVLMNGQINATDAIIRAAHRLQETENLSTGGVVSIHQLVSAFEILLSSKYICQCQDVVTTTPRDDGYVNSHTSDLKFTMPSDDLKAYLTEKICPLSDRPSVIKCEEDSNEPTAKRRRTLGGEVPGLVTQPDADIYYRFNLDRFLALWRDHVLIIAVEQRLDKTAGDLLRVILEKVEESGVEFPYQSDDVSHVEIVRSLPPNLSHLTPQQFDQYMFLLCEDAGEFLVKSGMAGGGTYSCPYKRACVNLSLAHLDSVVQERFGTKGLRIFRLLRFDRYLESDELERRVLMVPTECRNLLPKMVTEGFVGKTELSKTKEYFAQSIICYYKVNLEQVSRMVREWSIESLNRLLIRRRQEVADKSRLVSRQEHCSGLLKVLDLRLEQEPPEEEEEVRMILERRDFLLNQITPTEREKLDWLKKAVHKLSAAEHELDEAIFVFDLYLIYNQLK